MISKASFDFRARLRRLQKQLAAWSVDGCIIEDPIDLFYLTGLTVSKGRLLVTHKMSRFFVDNRYLQMAEKHSAVPAAFWEDAAIKALGKPLKKIAYDSATTTCDGLKLLRQSLSHLFPIPGLLRNLRQCKDKQEIAAMQKSAALTRKGHQHLLSTLKEGITEQEAALAFEFFCRSHGASAMAFTPIVAFGENSAMPHYRPGKRKLKKGDIVLCDLGVVLDGYCSDMTRMFYFGKVDARLIHAEAVVRMAHQAALALCRPGRYLYELDEAARQVMRTHGLEEHFLHSLGHGIGLCTHEAPHVGQRDRTATLQSGMVITIEPGLYFPGLGGIRHEDTIAITSQGYKNFYAA